MQRQCLKPARLLGLSLVFLSALAGLAHADRPAPVRIFNETDAAIKISTLSWQDADGDARDGGALWTFEPGESAVVSRDGETFVASRIRYLLKTEHGTAFMVASCDDDSEGDFEIHIRSEDLPDNGAGQVTVENTTDYQVNLESVAWIDKFGDREEHSLSWSLAPGQTASLTMDDEPIVARSFEYRLTRAGQSNGWTVNNDGGWDLDFTIRDEELPGPAQAQKLHVFYAVDLNAGKRGGDIGPNAKVSYEKLHQVLTEVFYGDPDKPQRAERVEFTQVGLNGEDIEPERILQYYRNLSLSSDDVLLFYYFGHGAWDSTTGQFLAMSGGDLLRTELRNAMGSTGARQIVLLTDCCSSYAEYTPPERRVPARWAAFQNLFFQHEGFVDISGATESQFGWSNARDGGFFTSALTYLLCEPTGTTDDNNDGFVTWDEFFPDLRAETDRNFDNAKARADADAEIQESYAQTPQALSLAFWPKYSEYLELVNNSGEWLSVCLQYYTLGPENTWYWYPDIGRTRWLEYSIAPGAQTLLTHEGFTIHAHSVHIWATGQTTGKQWVTYGRNAAPLRLSPLYGYGGNLQTFTFTFSP